MRVIGGVAIGEDTQSPPREDVRLHEAPACRPTALLVEDAHPHAVAGVRNDGRHRPLLAVDAKRQLARLVQHAIMRVAPPLISVALRTSCRVLLKAVAVTVAIPVDPLEAALRRVS